MKRILLFLCCLGWAFTSNAQKQLSFASPDGRLTTTIQIGEKLTYDIRLDGQQVLAPSPISMTLSDAKYGATTPNSRKHKRKVSTRPFLPLSINEVRL